MCNCPEEFDKIPSLVINLIDEDNLERPLCMSAEEYILKSVDPVTGNSTCVPAIQRGNRKQPVPLIFGMTFMRAFYTNFDLENHRIGFARSSLSVLPAHADCTVHNKKERQFWLVTMAFAGVAVGFAIYLCCCGDIGACCGVPSCEATKPCYGYSNLEDNADQKGENGTELQPTVSSSNGQAKTEMGPKTCDKAQSSEVSEHGVLTPRLDAAAVADSRPTPSKVPSSMRGASAPQQGSTSATPSNATPLRPLPIPENRNDDGIPNSARTV